jgi:hypothetical protein
MARDRMGQTVVMSAVCRKDWAFAFWAVAQGGYELLSAHDSLGLTCLDMIPAGCHEDEKVQEWIKSVQERDAQCSAFVQNMLQTSDVGAMPVERFRGDKWAVVIKAHTGCHVALFNNIFSTVRASGFMCPPGSAAYYELHVLRAGTSTQLGFCSEAFKRGDLDTNVGVGDDEASWGVDGVRLLKWHAGESPFGGRKWQEGDIIGLACDLGSGSDSAHQNQDESSPPNMENHGSETCNMAEAGRGGGSIWVSLNGDFSLPYGLVFHLEEGVGGLFAAFSSGRGYVRCNLGEEPFKHAPPDESFKPMCSFPVR